MFINVFFFNQIELKRTTIIIHETKVEVPRLLYFLLLLQIKILLFKRCRSGKHNL